MADNQVNCIPTQIGFKKNIGKMDYVMDLLKRGYEEIQFSQDKDIVLFLGNTGSGKSTLAHYIAGNSGLVSQEVEEATGEFIIIDKKKKISCDSTIVSHTVFPDLVVDMKTETAYYDCPGFSDTRSGANDICGTYFTKKIIDSAKSAKLIFVVSHHSVMRGVDRKDFLLLLKHAVGFIKKIDKFKNSIALVVTKVANNYIRTFGSENLVSDEKVITIIAKYIEQVKKDILEHPELIIESDQTHQSVEQAVNFLNALLFKDNNQYLRIGIFRRPDDIGELSSIELLQSRLELLQNMISENIHFTETSESDFDYTISLGSKNHIYDLVEETNNCINNELVAISEEIKKYYSIKEKDVFDIHELGKDFKSLCEAFSELHKFMINDSKEPREVILKIMKIIFDGKIIIYNEYFSRILILEDYIQFLYLVSNLKLQKNESTKLVKGVMKILEYFDESQKWYSFLSNFYSRLTQYDIQKRISEFNVSLPHHTTLTTEKIQFCDLSLPSSLIHIIEDVTSKGSGDLSSISLNENKLYLLQKVLEVTLNSKPDLIYSRPDTLIIKGHIVKMSDINIRECSAEVKFIEVLAVNKVYIDTSLDLTGREVQLAIIAPVWEVVGNQNIKLDGKPGDNHCLPKALGQIRGSTKGQYGERGQPGGPAGSFLGIGKYFINSEFLSISAHGGTGGKGQDGGDGLDGCGAVGMANAPKKFKNQLILLLYNKKVFDIIGQPGGDGGNGGFGGPPGSISILEVGKKTLENKVVCGANRGKHGKVGKEGKGGIGGRNCEKTYTNVFFFFDYESMENVNDRANNGMVGYSGTDLASYGSFTSYPSVTVKLQCTDSVINNFKSYSFDTLSNNINRNFLRSFINELDENEQVASLHGIKGLIEEMKDLEQRCFKLKNILSLIPSYQSLLRRIIKYAEKEELKEHKKVLSYLHMATLAKITTIGNSMNSALVLDITGFLDLMTKSIKKLKEVFHEVEVGDLLSQQIKLLTGKINEFQNFFDTQVTYEIDDAFQKIDNTMHSLLSESIALENADKTSLIKKEKQIKNSIELRVVLNIIKIGCSFLKFLGPVGIGFKILTNIGPMLLDSLLGDQIKQEMNQLPDVIKHALSEISAFIKSRPQIFLEQLKDAEQLLNKEPLRVKSIENIREKIINNKKKLEDEISQKNGYDLAIVGNIKKEIIELLKIENEKLKTMKDMGNIESISAINHIQNIFGLTTDLYSSIKNQKSKIDLVGSIMQGTDKRLRSILKYEEIIIPYFITLQQELSTIGERKVNRWKIQSTIKEIKYVIYELTKGFNIKEIIMHWIDKLQEGMATMIHVLDLIEGYQTEITLYRYLEYNHKLTKITIDDELMKAVDELKIITQSNLILGQYERAVSALKQRVFPFASMYLQNFSFKDKYDINDLVQNAIMTIEELKSKILDSAMSLGKYDEHIHIIRQTCFFVWPFDSYREAVCNLLEGKEILIEADIRKSLSNRNAVKFNVIDINLNAKDKALQEQLNKDLENFEVTMSHCGNSYYRCGDKFYYIFSSEKHDIKFSFKRNSAGEPTTTNQIYEKIKDNGFMLSPYTMWSIRLTSDVIDLDILHKYKNHAIDLMLVGDGQYIDEDFNKNICELNLDDHYQVDSTRNNYLYTPVSDKSI